MIQTNRVTFERDTAAAPGPANFPPPPPALRTARLVAERDLGLVLGR